ncbi:organic cation transporter protein [Ceratina calcarata]|uniref:Organic cation transporter protein n=1 Tax=Ceratina calcarata TaxID=156304 RepID=A0AAJ7IVA9_9HYME|nr:organic cation transporter protein [Ceratina calcarata]
MSSRPPQFRKSWFFWPTEPASEAVTLDDVLVYLGKCSEQTPFHNCQSKYVVHDPCNFTISHGEFGAYQKYLFGMLFFFCLFLTFVYFSQLFLTVVPKEHWCKVPEIKNFSAEQLRDYMIPSSKLVPREGDHYLPYSRCWIYDVPVEEAIKKSEPDPDWPMKKCDEWEFKYTAQDVPYESVAAEQKWVCDATYKVTLAQSIFFGGAILGGLVFGWMADKYGRVPVLVGTNMLGFIGGVSTMYVSEFWHFCACRFVVGLAYDNTFTIAYILVLEYVGPEWRTFAANMSYGVFYTMSAMSLPWIAYSIADWRLFALVTSVPLSSAIFAPFLLPESVRWLIGKGKINRAMRIIWSIEKINRTVIPPDIYEEFEDDCQKTAEELSAETHSIKDLFRTKRLRKTTLLLIAVWGVIQMSYDGHIRCLDTLGMDVFITFTLASATELPSEILITYTLDVVGRRWLLFTAVTLSGLLSLGAACFPMGAVYTSLAICSRFFINVSSNIAMQFAAELLPTVIRGEGVAFIHVIGYVTSLFSPFIAFSSTIMYNLPMIILGVSCIVAGILSLFLPETLYEQLPQTLMDGELFGIDQMFWETPLTKKKPPEPKVHHLHAKRAVSRPGMLRSSMISGHKGIERRHTQMKRRASQMPGAAGYRRV